MLNEGLQSYNRICERIVFVDVARGIAAILVVIGHSIQVVDSAFDNNIIFRMIYSFHMPLFMFLSGYVSYKPEGIDYKWIIKKAEYLAVPFIVWTILPVLFSGNAEDIFERVYAALKQPDVSFWFLIILFYCDVLLFIQTRIEQVIRRIKYGTSNCNSPHIAWGVLLSVLICFSIKIIALTYPEYGMALLSWHCVFFFMGYWVKRLSISVKVQKTVFLILAFMWIPLVVSWSRIKLPDYIMNFAVHMSQWQFERFASIYNYIVAFSGIGFSILVSMLLCRIEIIEKQLSKIGVFTAEMYLMQGLFYNIIRTQYIFLNILCNMILGVIMPLIICYLMKQGKMTGVLFGKKYR